MRATICRGWFESHQPPILKPIQINNLRGRISDVTPPRHTRYNVPVLTLHRRHLKSCDHAAKGWNYTLCDCPVWCDGTLGEKRLTRSLQTRSWDRALPRLAALERGADINIETESVRSVAQAAEAFLRNCERRNLEESTLRSYRKTFDHLGKSLGKRPLSRVEVDDIQAHMDKRTDRKGGELGPRSFRKEIEHLRAMWAWCIERGWCEKNPAKGVRPPQAEDLATLPFTEDERNKLLAACDRMQAMWQEDAASVRRRARALLLALLYSGLRISDIAKLKRGSLESSGHLVLRVMKTGVPLKVLLHPDARAALASLPAPSGNPTYFFWTGRGKLSSVIGSLRRTVDRVGKLAGIHAHPHRFRDTFAVELLTQGADIRTVQQLLGHESLQTTERHYAHFVAAHQALLDSATARLDFSPKVARPVLVSTDKRRRRNAK